MSIYITSLKTDYVSKPLALKDSKPCFSWIVESNEKRKKQTSFRVLVSSSKEVLEKNEGDIWDSGKTNKEENYCYYNGKPLEK